MGEEVLDVLLTPRKEIIDADDIGVALDEVIAEMTPQEAGAAGDQNTVHFFSP